MATALTRLVRAGIDTNVNDTRHSRVLFQVRLDDVLVVNAGICAQGHQAHQILYRQLPARSHSPSQAMTILHLGADMVEVSVWVEGWEGEVAVGWASNVSWKLEGEDRQHTRQRINRRVAKVEARPTRGFASRKTEARETRQA